MVMRFPQRVQALREALNRGQAEQALPMAEELVRLYPDSPTAYGLLAEFHRACRHWAEALEIVRQACYRFPRHRGLQYLLRALEEEAVAEERARETARDIPLRLIEGAGEATVHLRSSLVRLIPGLEFAPLHSELLELSSHLPPPPPFPAEVERAWRQAEVLQPESELTPLEELAQRLERARIPVPDEDIPPAEEPPDLPPVATETMARVYEQQGAYELALRVYEELVARHPERRSQYEAAQARLREKLQHGNY